MKHCVAAVAVSLAVGLAGCDDKSPAGVSAAAETLGAEVADAAEVGAKTASALAHAGSAEQIAGAPAFVALYPGAQIQEPEAGSPAKQITFITDAAPDAVIAFYKDRAESSGLHPMAAMNQGEARAYGASDRNEAGKSIQVVASPGENGQTSVQLNWSEEG